MFASNNESMKELTKAEEQIMQVIWQRGQAFVKEIIEELPAPKPAYNTVSTIVRILEEKGFTGHEAFGKSHRYFPLVSQSDYRDFATKKLLHGYFGGKFENLLSYFARKDDLDIKDLEEILNSVDKNNNRSENQ